ncbi:hypothetical protein B0H13DRAFT_2650814 [Mycena leptocephala]|nr:hypothetical protein B0H13DRAFT_2650814 [Mycena leptocephala]
MARNSAEHPRALERHIIAHWGIPVGQQAYIFDLWLKRSRFCPLSLQIAGGTGIDEILAAVVPHRARWEHLELEDMSITHLPIIDGPIPLLRHLNLTLYDSFTDATEVFAFRDVPLLRSVILDAVAVPSMILPWAQLTSLTLLRVYPCECVPVLQKTPNLVRCVLEVCFDIDNDQPGPDIPLPCLESLTLVDPGGRPVVDFLETFIVPALRRLKILEVFLGPSPLDSLTGFISKSGCKLEKLHIARARLLPQDSYRQAFPSIRKFSFDGKDHSSDSEVSDVESE